MSTSGGQVTANKRRPARIVRRGAVAVELRAKQHLSLRQLTSQYSRQRLSLRARRVLMDAHTQLTGVMSAVNEYCLAETLSEAIEAAEALNI